MADLESTFGAMDAQAWGRLSGLWERLEPHLLQSLFTPFPPVRAGAALAAKLRAADGLRAARFLTLPVRRLAQEEFTQPGAGLLLAGCALHADLLPESAGSSAFGWLMAMLGQQVGWPVRAVGRGDDPVNTAHGQQALDRIRGRQKDQRPSYARPWLPAGWGSSGGGTGRFPERAA